jgi:hypothetical protein
MTAKTVRLGSRPLMPAIAWLLAVALFPAVGWAHRTAQKIPKVYISTCDRAVVAPQSFEVVCVSPGGLLGTTFPSFAEHLVYHQYGSAVAHATGTLRACLLGPVENLQLCPVGLLPPSEEAETSRGHLLPASFKFFDVVTCTHVESFFTQRFGSARNKTVFYRSWHLLYAEFSYRLAGQTWNTRSIMPRNEVETSIQPTCRHVKLSRR